MALYGNPAQSPAHQAGKGRICTNSRNINSQASQAGHPHVRTAPRVVLRGFGSFAIRIPLKNPLDGRNPPEDSIIKTWHLTMLHTNLEGGAGGGRGIGSPACTHGRQPKSPKPGSPLELNH